MSDSTPVVVFAGDSVTDCGRREDPRGLGNGYVERIAASPLTAGLRIVNRGISGDRVRDLRARWEADVVSADASMVSILVGVNDTWRRFDSGDPTSAESFATDYRALLDGVAGVPLVLIEPFLLPARPEQHAWREDLDEKIAVVHELASEYSATLIRADSLLPLAGTAEELAPDGVHPSEEGHETLARLWLTAATPLVERLHGL